MDELKPCPFCGATGNDYDLPVLVWFLERETEWKVEGERCGANTGWRGRKTREEAIKAWNRRATVESDARSAVEAGT